MTCSILSRCDRHGHVLHYQDEWRRAHPETAAVIARLASGKAADIAARET